MKIIGNQWKSMEIDGNESKSMEINWNQWKLKENQWKLELRQVDRKPSPQEYFEKYYQTFRAIFQNKKYDIVIQIR